jgi:hypothetical protein
MFYKFTHIYIKKVSKDFDITLYRWRNFILASNPNFSSVEPYYKAVKHVEEPIITLVDVAKSFNVFICQIPRCGKVDAIARVNHPQLIFYRFTKSERFFTNGNWNINFIRKK